MRDALPQVQQALRTKSSFIFAAVFLTAYLLADTASLVVDFFLPEPPVVPVMTSLAKIETNKTTDLQASILHRNIFSSQGNIPPEDLASMIPRKSNLPLKITGCMIFEDELNSIATFEETSNHATFTAQVGDTLLGSHRVVRIENRKVFLQSLASENLEYLEMEDNSHGFELEILNQNLNPRLSAIHKGKTGQEVRQIRPGEVEIDKAFFEKILSNPVNVLKQALAVPYFENGNPAGFILVEVQPGGVFDKMGLKRDDILLSFNGEPLSDSGNIMGKVTQLIQDLRQTDRASMTIRRQGQVVQQQFYVR